MQQVRGYFAENQVSTGKTSRIGSCLKALFPLKNRLSNLRTFVYAVNLWRCDRVEPNMTNVVGFTALFLAVMFDHVDVVLALLASPRTGDVGLGFRVWGRMLHRELVMAFTRVHHGCRGDI